MKDVKIKNLFNTKIPRVNGEFNKQYQHDYICGTCGKGFNVGQKHDCQNKKTLW